MVLFTQIKGNKLIKQNPTKTGNTIQNHPKENKKETERKQADDEPFHRQEVTIL